MLRSVHAVRYVLPFRQGGSVPALVEADDLGLYVVKLRGASQGPKVLVAIVSWPRASWIPRSSLRSRRAPG